MATYDVAELAREHTGSRYSTADTTDTLPADDAVETLSVTLTLVVEHTTTAVHSIPWPRPDSVTAVLRYIETAIERRDANALLQLAAHTDDSDARMNVSLAARLLTLQAAPHDATLVFRAGTCVRKGPTVVTTRATLATTVPVPVSRDFVGAAARGVLSALDTGGPATVESTWNACLLARDTPLSTTCAHAWLTGRVGPDLVCRRRGNVPLDDCPEGAALRRDEGVLCVAYAPDVAGRPANALRLADMLTRMPSSDDDDDAASSENENDEIAVVVVTPDADRLAAVVPHDVPACAMTLAQLCDADAARTDTQEAWLETMDSTPGNIALITVGVTVVDAVAATQALTEALKHNNRPVRALCVVDADCAAPVPLQLDTALAAPAQFEGQVLMDDNAPREGTVRVRSMAPLRQGLVNFASAVAVPQALLHAAQGWANTVITHITDVEDGPERPA